MTKLLADNAPKSMREQKFESYFGRRIAVDASMSIYQFLVMPPFSPDPHGLSSIYCLFLVLCLHDSDLGLLCAEESISICGWSLARRTFRDSA